MRSPLDRGKTLIEGLVGNRLSEGNHKVFITVLIRLVGQKEHLQVSLDSQELPGICQVVEEIGAPSGNMDGDDVPFSLFGF